MSFVLKLQTNNSDAICVDKDLTEVVEVTGTLKEKTNISNPIFVIALTPAVIPNFNYISCPDFGRSYFVKNVSSIRGGLWEVQCEVDVLTSFASEIRKNKAIIKRQEKSWNLYYNDGTFRSYQNPHIVTREFPSGFMAVNPSFVLAVAGGITENDT